MNEIDRTVKRLELRLYEDEYLILQDMANDLKKPMNKLLFEIIDEAIMNWLNEKPS